MRDRLRKYRKDDYVEKRFGKDINISAKDEAPLRKPMAEAETKSVSEAKPGGAKPMAGRSSFGAAFAAARRNPEAMKAGKFTWQGKEYSTALAGEKKSAPARRAPAASAAPAKTQAAPAKTQAAPAKTQAAPAKTQAAPAKTQAAPAKQVEPVTRASAFAALQEKNKPATDDKPTKAEPPKRTEAQQRGDYASRLTQRAAEKRKLESAPTETPGSSLARLKNIVGLGSSADERLAQTMRRAAAQTSRAEGIKKRIADENAAAAARRIAEGKAKAKAGNPFYQSYLNKAKGGKIDGIAVRGKTKIGRK